VVDRTGKIGFQRKIHKDIKREIPYEYKEEKEADQVVGGSLDDESSVESPGNEELGKKSVSELVVEHPESKDNLDTKMAAIEEMDKASLSSSKTTEEAGESLSDTAAEGARAFGVDDDDKVENLDTKMPAAAAVRETRASRNVTSKSKVTVVDPSKLTSSVRFLEPSDGLETMGKDTDLVRATRNEQASNPMSSKMADISLEAVGHACLLPTASICKRFKCNSATLRKASECRVAFQYVAPVQSPSRSSPPKDSQNRVVASKPSAPQESQERGVASKPKHRIIIGRIKSEKFREWVIPILESLGWNVGKERKYYSYILPGRDSFKQGGKLGCDYYRDVPDLAKLLKSDARWKDSKEIRKALQMFEKEVQKSLDPPQERMAGPKSKKLKTSAPPASIQTKRSRFKTKLRICDGRRPNNAIFREFVLPVLQGLGWSTRIRSGRY
jgi:hypothetical protein